MFVNLNEISGYKNNNNYLILHFNNYDNFLNCCKKISDGDTISIPFSVENNYNWIEFKNCVSESVTYPKISFKYDKYIINSRSKHRNKILNVIRNTF